MAGDKKNITIIRKKKGGGHAAAHGGAWKVAYADFVTAMMAFFLVMWLMGSDEETKAEISHYFNHPATPWKNGGDPDSRVARPLGERRGEGDSVLNGLDGANPDDLVPNPQRPVAELQANRELSEKVQGALEDMIYAVEIDIDSMRFSISDQALFKPNSTDLTPDAEKYLSKVGTILKGYSGYVALYGHMDPTLAKLNGRSPASIYEYSMAKAVTVMKHMVTQKYVAEERVFPRGSGAEVPFSNEESARAHQKNQRIEFVLSKKKPRG